MSEKKLATAFADAWIDVDHTADPSFFVQVLDATRAERLERARRSPAEFFQALRLRPGLRVLDVGCGTGDLLRLLGPLVAPGDAIGIDLSDTMIVEATHRCHAGPANVSFRGGNVHDLQCESASFDRVVATQVLQHVPDPDRALAEMFRVTSPSGLVFVHEADWAALGIECSDRELGRRFARLTCDGIRNGFIARELPWRLHHAGFEGVRVVPETVVSLSPDAFHRWFIEPSLSHFARIGAFSTAEIGLLVDDLAARAAAGRYFTSRTFYSITASRPS